MDVRVVPQMNFAPADIEDFFIAKRNKMFGAI